MANTCDTAIPHARPSTGRVAAYIELVRPRIAVLVLVATAAGFVLASPTADMRHAGLLASVLLGVTLVAAGANTLNQVIEANWDALMARTMDRPIPSKRLSRTEALLFGLACGLGGVFYLTLLTSPLAGALGGATFASYVLVYTPLKRTSWHSVFVGAIPGALPPVIGWAAATGTVSTAAWMLFGIVYVWQLPHFAAIAWLHRDDYSRAGYPMLSVVDRCGERLCRHMIRWSWVLLAASLIPAGFGVSGLPYAAGAALFGLAFVAVGLRFAQHRTLQAARVHLLASVVYLPLLFGLMMFDKVL